MASPSRGQTPYFSPMASQTSLYNLNLDDVQNQLNHIGKQPLNNMNLDDLLKSVIAADENQILQNQNASSSSSSAASFFPTNLNLYRTPNKKTVNGVWREIVQQDHQGSNVVGDDGGGTMSIEKEPSLGETTLEDFLIRAGAINIENQDTVVTAQQPSVTIDPVVVTSQQADWLEFQMVDAQQQQQQMAVLGSTFPTTVSVLKNPVGYSDNQMVLSDNQMALSDNQMALSMIMPFTAATATSSDVQVSLEKKRRFSDEMMEKTIERRQKRMIKNRESAARSRAKKQAYTNKLEQDMSLLMKTNELLIKQKEAVILLNLDSTPVPKYQLRRTSSASF